MSQRLNRALSSAISTGAGRTLRQRLALTTILAVVPFLGYGRQAYADCVDQGGSVVVCSDEITGANLNYNNADVSTLASPPFVVTDNGLFINGNGHIQFHDYNASSINNNIGNGLDVRSFGNFNGTDGAVTIVTNGTIIGTGTGIFASNGGDGDIDITANGKVTGNNNDGIRARNYGADLKITTGASSNVYGRYDGIDAGNFGDGDLEVTAKGIVTGDRYNGVYARNSADGADLMITAEATSVVTGGYNGIYARNYGDGDLEVTADGQVTGEDEDGIRAINTGDLKIPNCCGGFYYYSGNGHDLTVTTGAASNVTGAENGINAINSGNGDLTITANGVVTGEDGDGIHALNIGGNFYNFETGNTYYGDGHDLTITTGAGSAVTGSDDGIDAENTGDGDLTITVGGSSIGEDGDGIEAFNSFDGHDLTITTEAGSVVTGLGDGIYARNEGDGDLEITVGGAVTGLSGLGIATFNGGSGETDIKVEAGGLVQSYFIAIAAFSAYGQDITITNDGTVRNLSGGSDFPTIYTLGGATDITTNGVLIGTVTTDIFKDFDDDMENGGFWNTAGGVNDFGGGDDEFTNTATGTLLAADDPTAPEVTAFNGLETFNNAGLVSLVDGQPGDNLFLNNGADYEGQDGRLAVDAILGPSPDGLSDRLFVNGDVSGTPSRVHVNVAGATGANLVGIPVVSVVGTTVDGDFILDGPLNAGFFTWDIRRDGDTHELFTSGVGLGSFEFAAGISGGQEVWHQTTGTLLQRQADLRSLLNGAGVTPVADFGEPVAPTPTANITPGFWLRGLGAYVERDDEENGFTLDRKQTIWGGMAGFDFGTEGAGDVWMFGLFGGYITSNLDFTETNSEWTYEGPTVGAYVSYLKQGLYADVTVKADFLDVNIDPDDIAPTSDDEDTDALNLGARLDAGYKFGDTLFVEPQATLAVLYTEIDDVDIFGGTVEFDDQTSFRGRLGLRVGFDHTDSTGTVYSADVTGSAWEDFSGDNEVTIANSGLPNFSVSDDPGQTIGDVSLGFSVAAPEGWSGFLRGNYLFGSDYEAVSGNAGVRYAW